MQELVETDPERHLTTWHLTELMTRPDKIRTCSLICWSHWPIGESQQCETGQWEGPSRRTGIYTVVYFGRHIQLDGQHCTETDRANPLCMFVSACYLCNNIFWVIQAVNINHIQSVGWDEIWKARRWTSIFFIFYTPNNADRMNTII